MKPSTLNREIDQRPRISKHPGRYTRLYFHTGWYPRKPIEIKQTLSAWSHGEDWPITAAST